MILPPFALRAAVALGGVIRSVTRGAWRPGAGARVPHAGPRRAPPRLRHASHAVGHGGTIVDRTTRRDATGYSG